MKYSITINQVSAQRHGIDWIDAGLFAVLSDMMASNSLQKKLIHEKVYTWVSLKLILDEIPQSGISCKRALQRRLETLKSKNLIRTITIANEGNRLFICAGESFDSMIFSGKDGQDAKLIPPSEPKVHRVANQKSSPSEPKVHTLVTFDAPYPSTTPDTNPCISLIKEWEKRYEAKSGNKSSLSKQYCIGLNTLKSKHEAPILIQAMDAFFEDSYASGAGWPCGLFIKQIDQYKARANNPDMVAARKAEADRREADRLDRERYERLKASQK